MSIKKFKRHVTYDELYKKVLDKNDTKMINYLSNIGNTEIVFVEETEFEEDGEINLSILPDERNNSFVVLFPYNSISEVYEQFSFNKELFYYKHQTIILSENFSTVEIVMFDIVGKNFIKKAFEEVLDFTTLYKNEKFAETPIEIDIRKITIAEDIFTKRKEDFDRFALLVLNKIKNYNKEIYDNIIENGEINLVSHITITGLLDMLNIFIDEGKELIPVDPEVIDYYLEKDNNEDNNEEEDPDEARLFVKKLFDTIRYEVIEEDTNEKHTPIYERFGDNHEYLKVIIDKKHEKNILKDMNITKGYFYINDIEDINFLCYVYQTPKRLDVEYFKNKDLLFYLIIDNKNNHFEETVESLISDFSILNVLNFKEVKFFKSKNNHLDVVSLTLKFVATDKKNKKLFEKVMKETNEKIRLDKENIPSNLSAYIKDTFFNFILGYNYFKDFYQKKNK